MRNVTFGINISLDGYCDHTAFNPCEDVHDYFTGIMEDADLIFFGRIMYQLMFPYWSDIAKNQSGSEDENRFAEKLCSIDKVVISRTLEHAAQKTRIIRRDPAGELLKLKQQPGKKIMADSISLLPELITAGLIDEFHFVVHPVMMGKGRRLLDHNSIGDKLNLRLLDTIRFKSGCVAHHYLKQ